MHKPPVAADRPLPSESSQRQIIAAVDLGSNSFHMIVAELRYGQLVVIDRLRETVRLAEGLSPEGDLSIDARHRALDCLSRFGQRLRDIEAHSVRAAGTATIRRAEKDAEFMAEAEAALGHPIDVISGLEEARLVYSGVSHSLPPTDGMRLVTDIGGGSTEIILGRAAKPQTMESLHMGCVSMTERYFPNGVITAEGFDKARVAARLELRPVKAFFQNVSDLQVIGTSGTIRATHAVAEELGLVETALTLAIVESLIEAVVGFKTTDDISLKGLSDRRAQVWPGGLVILAELLNSLQLAELKVSDGALREGLLYDLLGRLQQEDERGRTVRAMALRYQVDAEQADRVAATAASLYSQCRETREFDGDMPSNMLDWAARLHEIGLNISHDGYQRHGAYIAEHADMPGFPQSEQRLLAMLIGSQRHRVDRSRLSALPGSWREQSLTLVVILRLAVLLNRNRGGADGPNLKLTVGGQCLSLHFDAQWRAANPLTIADLECERGLLSNIGYELVMP